MALVLKDRVKETSTTAGTGTLTLAGAAAGFQSFAAIGNGNTTYYAIVDSTAGTWEVGIGTYTSSGTTLSRTTVLSSSNGGSLVGFAANSKDVFCTYPSEKSVYLDSADVVTQQTFGAITATSAALTTGTITTAPTNDNDIVNKAYADSIATGINFHPSCNYATTADLGTVTYNNGASGVGATLTKITTFATLSIDGANPTVGQRILVKNQTSGAQNGIYTVTSVGSGVAGWVLTRATDYDTSGTGTNEIDQGDVVPDLVWHRERHCSVGSTHRRAHFGREKKGGGGEGGGGGGGGEEGSVGGCGEGVAGCGGWGGGGGVGKVCSGGSC